VFSLAVFLAARTFSQGRGDIRGASRLAAFVFACTILGWLCTANHVQRGLSRGDVIFSRAGSAERVHPK
jgi:hypothetical protein